VVGVIRCLSPSCQTLLYVEETVAGNPFVDLRNFLAEYLLQGKDRPELDLISRFDLYRRIFISNSWIERG
jgi:hypothetical protein